MKKLDLTKAESKTLAFVTKYITKKGKAPTYQEIADGLKLSPITIWFYITKLTEKGWIKLNKKLKSRKIILK